MVSKQSNLSTSETIPDLTPKEDEKLIDRSAKKRKLSASAHDVLREESKEGLIKTGNPHAELMGPNSLQEFVFSIDHILELILMKCDKETLFNSRLVSRRWAYYGSKELEKTVVLTFCKSYSTSEAPPSFCSDLSETHPVEGLIALMNNSTKFPSNSFVFRSDPDEDDTCHETAQEFFNAHGASVKKLFFHQHLYIEDLRHLLLNQAPNIQHLYLGPIKILSKNSTDSMGLFDDNSLKPTLKNLKVFKCHFELKVPKVFISQILECSPNLTEVALPSSRLDLLVHPINRVHLLKKIKIDTNSCSVQSLTIFGNHLQENKNLAVSQVYCISGDCEGEEVDSQEMCDAVGNILKGCSATCLKLVWLAYLFNLQIPQMPQVNHLTIEYFPNEDTDRPINNLTDASPDGVSMAETFPNLKYLDLRTQAKMGNLPIPNIFRDVNVNPSPAANIKTVTLRLRGHGEEVVESLKKMFPNASIHNKAEFPCDVDGYDTEDYDEDDTKVC